MFSSIKIAIIFMISGTLVAGAVYVKKLQEDLDTARANVAKMEVAVQTSEASLKLMQEETVRLNTLNQQLGDDLRKAEEYGDELRNTLQKHNLTHLANKKPGLIQNRMQDATDKLWDDLADITDPNRVQQSVESTGTTNPSSN
jgi:chromosome segregation ATPase